MKVSNLIEILKDLPQDAEVVAGHTNIIHWVESVEDILTASIQKGEVVVVLELSEGCYNDDEILNDIESVLE